MNCFYLKLYWLFIMVFPWRPYTLLETIQTDESLTDIQRAYLILVALEDQWEFIPPHENCSDIDITVGCTNAEILTTYLMEINDALRKERLIEPVLSMSVRVSRDMTLDEFLVTNDGRRISVHAFVQYLLPIVKQCSEAFDIDGKLPRVYYIRKCQDVMRDTLTVVEALSMTVTQQ